MSHALWYFSRGTGLTSLLLLTAVMLLGIASSLGWTVGRTPRFVVHGLHRNLTLLAVVFIALHVVSAILDGYVGLRLVDAVVPFRATYRPLWVGLGAVAFDLLLALVISSLLRVRLGLRLWRGLHWLAYACWPVAVVHGLGTGTDARTRWLFVPTALCVAAVCAAVLVRCATGWPRRTGLRAAVAVAVLALPAVGLLWYVDGPGKRGWAARAGGGTGRGAPAAPTPKQTPVEVPLGGASTLIEVAASLPAAATP